jgi:hypothetical protein
MLRREYRTRANSPSGAIADQDTFTYDPAGRILTSVKGRYANTVTFTYANGRKATESLAVFGQTYTVGYAYDSAGRENTLTYPDGSVVTRTYTPRNQYQQVNYAPPGGVARLVVRLRPWPPRIVAHLRQRDHDDTRIPSRQSGH